MKVWAQTAFGGPGALALETRPDPVPGKGEVLVHIAATSLNASDMEFLTGHPGYVRTGAPFGPRGRVLGSDIAGTITALGPEVTEFRTGDPVFGDVFDRNGGFAERVAAKANRLIAVPEGMDMVTAAALPQAGVIALQALRGLDRGDKVLINGAGGGMGSFAVQIAIRAGAEVTAVDSAQKTALLEALGAHRIVDFRKTDFTAEGIAYDRILDLKATRPSRAIARTLAPGGHYVMVGGDFGPLLNVAFIGGLGSRIGRWGQGRRLGLHFARQSRDELAEIAALVGSGAVRAVIDRVYGFNEVPDAFTRLIAGEALGKLVVKIG